MIAYMRPGAWWNQATRTWIRTGHLGRFAPQVAVAAVSHPDSRVKWHCQTLLALVTDEAGAITANDGMTNLFLALRNDARMSQLTRRI